MRKESVKNHGKSIRSKLLNVAQNEGIYYQTILTRYFQERLIYRISQTPYRQNFYLKGGALMAALRRRNCSEQVFENIVRRAWGSVLVAVFS